MIRKSYSYCITAAFFSILFIVGTSSVSAQDIKSPLYRFWSSQNASHFYTMDEGEKNYIAGNYPEDVWKYE